MIILTKIHHSSSHVLTASNITIKQTRHVDIAICFCPFCYKYLGIVMHHRLLQMAGNEPNGNFLALYNIGRILAVLSVILYIWAQYYKTFYVRNLRTFVIS